MVVFDGKKVCVRPPIVSVKKAPDSLEPEIMGMPLISAAFRMLSAVMGSGITAAGGLVSKVKLCGRLGVLAFPAASVCRTL